MARKNLNSDWMNPPFRGTGDSRLTMKGGIHSKQKCPICGEKFQIINNDMVCPTHFTRPNRFYIHIYSRQLHKYVNINSDSKGRPFAAYEEADRCLAAIRNEIDQNEGGDFDPTNYVAQHIKSFQFSNWSEDWLNRLKTKTEQGKRSPAYLKAVRVYIRKYLQPFFKKVHIADIGNKAISDFQLSLTGSPHYVKNIVDCLMNMLGDAYDWNQIKKMPKCEEVQVPDVDIQTIDLDVQDQIINSIPDRMDRAFILFTAREMVRPSETRALFWQDIDLQHDRVTIRRHFSLNTLRPTTKAKQIKILPIDAEVKSALLNLPRHLSSPFVFYKRDGHPFSESWARKLWKRIASQLGVQVSLYPGTRHSSATEATNRAGLDAVQEFLHHSNRRTTQRYVKQNPDRLRKVLRGS